MNFLNFVNKMCKKQIRSINNSYFRAFHRQELRIEGMSLDKYINKLQCEYSKLLHASCQSPRFTQLQPIISLIDERRDIIKNVHHLEELLDEKDGELKLLAEEERELFREKLLKVDCALKELLLPVDEEDNFNSITLEVNAGVGGQEAMLFASEIFDMYLHFASYKGWQYELAEYMKTETGGIRHGALLINGSGVYKYFRHEAGVHRVQRIPSTEKSGRIHTSTVSVLALPQPDEIQVQIDGKDLKIETKRATGAGGQHVNTTDSAVRIVHLPTGVAVECQTDRSQRRNKEVALLRLKAKLYQLQLDAQSEKVQATKKSQVKSNFRNEKIRTYNFSQDRITDHRLENHNVYNLKRFLTGCDQLENLILKIDYNRRILALKELIGNGMIL